MEDVLTRNEFWVFISFIMGLFAADMTLTFFLFGQKSRTITEVESKQQSQEVKMEKEISRSRATDEAHAEQIAGIKSELSAINRKIDGGFKEMVKRWDVVYSVVQDQKEMNNTLINEVRKLKK